jgi:hydrogenase/urease accessory protein HupE
MRSALLSLCFCGIATAHQIAEMPLLLKVSGDQVRGVIEADAAYMLEEFRGDDEEEPKDLAWLREQGPDGWQRIRRETEAYWRACLRFEADGGSLPWTLRIPTLEGEAPAILRDGEPEDPPFIEVVLEARLPPGARKLEAAWHEPFGVVLIVTTGDAPRTETTPVVTGERVTLAERTAAAPEMSPAAPSPGNWVALGFEHILPKGVDHILFVLGLFLLVPKWRPLLQQTITFTVAHSVSLAAAALGWVSFPPTPVEVLIAASIAWVGLENLWTKELGSSRLALVAVFGLVHGLGFASVLADLLPADQPGKLPAALLGFNIGVELGQIVVLAAAFACFGWLGERFRHVKRAGSVAIATAGLVLVAERLAGISLNPFSS